MTVTAKIYDVTDLPEGGIYLKVPYDRDFLDEFRDTFDGEYEEREWLPDDKMWWVSKKRATRAIRVASRYWNLEYAD
jgi:hypothetical protein